MEGIVGGALVRHPSKFPEVSHDHQLRNARGQGTRRSKQFSDMPMEISFASSAQSSDTATGGKQVAAVAVAAAVVAFVVVAVAAVTAVVSAVTAVVSAVVAVASVQLLQLLCLLL